MGDHRGSGATSPPGASARRWAQPDATLFLDRLAECGNVRIAAAAAGFSPATVYAWRRSEADFAARWIAALEAWRASKRPRGTITRYTREGHAKRVRCQLQWSEEIEELFLDHLAASCNVSLAAAEAGVGHTSVYRQRRLRADFAEKWQAALEQGYARLELALVNAATDSLAGVAFDADRPIQPMSAEAALKVLQAHRAAVLGVGRHTGWSGPPKGVEHYRGSILRKIAAIRAARALPAPEDGTIVGEAPDGGDGAAAV